jgi:hypothetical protein
MWGDSNWATVLSVPIYICMNSILGPNWNRAIKVESCACIGWG